MHGCMEGWKGGRKDGRMDVWMERWVHGWIGSSMHGWNSTRYVIRRRDEGFEFRMLGVCFMDIAYTLLRF